MNQGTPIFKSHKNLHWVVQHILTLGSKSLIAMREKCCFCIKVFNKFMALLRNKNVLRRNTGYFRKSRFTNCNKILNFVI